MIYWSYILVTWKDIHNSQKHFFFFSQKRISVKRHIHHWLGSTWWNFVISEFLEKKILPTGKQQNPSSKISFFLIFVDPEIQWCWLDSSNRVLVTSENAAKSGLLLSGIVFSLLGVDPALFRSFWKQNKLFLVSV